VLEGAFNRKLKKALTAALPNCVVLKHNDISTGGIPDFSVSNGVRTLWIEVKMKGNFCTPLQMNTLMRFREAALEIVANKDGKEASLYYDKNSKQMYLFFDELVAEIARRVNVT
jgi:hypothetical protein